MSRITSILMLLFISWVLSGCSPETENPEMVQRAAVIPILNTTVIADTPSIAIMPLAVCDDPWCPNLPEDTDCKDDNSCEPPKDECDSACEARNADNYELNEVNKVGDSAVAGAASDAEDAGGELGDENLDDATDEEGKIAAAQLRAEKLAEGTGCTCGNPVDLTTGSKLVEKSDLESYYGLLEISRNHKLANLSSWSLGKGWFSSLDSRVILGVDLSITQVIEDYELAIANYLAAIASIDTSIAEFEASHVAGPKTAAAVAGFVAQMEALKAPYNLKIATIKNDILPNLRAEESISNTNHYRNLQAVDQNYLTEEQFGIESIKWIDPSGSRYTFNDDGSSILVGKRANSHKLEKLADGYRVTTKDRIYTYALSGLLTSLEDKFGHSVELIRDSQQVITRLITNSGLEFGVEYISGKITTITDPVSRSLRYDYDYLGRLVTVTHFDGHTESYDYDFNGDNLAITAVIDGEGNKKENHYKLQAGNTVVDYQEDEIGKQRHYDYQFGSNKATYTDRREFQNEMTYDPVLKRPTVSEGAFGIVLTNLDNKGRVLTRTNELFETVEYTYTDLGQIETQTVEGRTTTYFYDQDRIVTITDNLGNITTYQRDENGQIDKILFPNGTEIDENWVDGLIQQRIDQDGNVTEWLYDEYGYPERIDYFGTIKGDNDDSYQAFDYDAAGRILWVVEGGANTDASTERKTEYFYYDEVTQRDMDKPVLIIDPLGRIATFTYDGNNNVLEHVDFSGIKTTYTYSPRRLVNTKTISMPDPDDSTKVVNYVYHYGYDAEENLETAIHPGGIVWKYSYDARGNLLHSWIESNPEVMQSYTYDLAGRKQTENDHLNGIYSYTYFADGQLESVTNPLGNVQTYNYDYRGDLDSVYDAEVGKYVVDYTRNELGQITATQDGNGHIHSVALNNRGQVEDIFVPNSSWQKRIDQTLDWRGKPVAIADVEGGLVNLQYNDFGELVSSTDTEGATITRDYDALGRLVYEINAAGLITIRDFDQQLNKLVVTETQMDPTMSVVRNDHTRISVKTYDLMGHLIHFKDALHQEWSFEYNIRGLLEKTVNPDGTQIINTYDAAGQLDTTTQTALASDNVPDRVTDYLFDYKGRLLRERLPHMAASQFNRYEYNGLGQIDLVTMVNYAQTDYQYDSAGRLTNIYYPENLSESWAYDANHNRIAHIDRDGYRWKYDYTADNQLKHSWDPVSVENYRSYSTERTYDLLGRFTGIIDGKNQQQTITLDSMGRKDYITDGEGKITDFVVDAAGRVIAVTDANNVTTHYFYNAFGDLEWQEDANGNKTWFAHDLIGRRTQQTNVQNQTTNWDYNSRNQVTASTELFGTAQARTTDQQYNSFGNLESVTRQGDFGPVTAHYDWRADNKLLSVSHSVSDPWLNSNTPEASYSYNTIGQMTGHTNELGKTWIYSVNDLGQVKTVIQPESGTNISYLYDGRGHVTNRQFTDPKGQYQNETLAYDGAGRLQTINNAALHEEYAYDETGALETVTNHTLGQTLGQTYDANGRKTGVQVNDDTWVYYDRDNAGRIEFIRRVDSLGTDTYSLAYTDLNQVRSIVYPNGTRRRLTYDNLGRIDGILIEVKKGNGYQTLEDFAYFYDAYGNLEQEVRNGYMAQFEYDSLNRLVFADYLRADDISYEWDDLGNLRTKGTKTHNFEYEYNDANQLSRFTAHRLPGFGCEADQTGSDSCDLSELEKVEEDGKWYRYSYDENGYPTKLASEQGIQYMEHDALGRMTEVRNPNGEEVSYGYDSRDRKAATDQHLKYEIDTDGDGVKETYFQDVSLVSQFDGRQEIGQWIEEQSQFSNYRSLTTLPMEQQGLPYGQVLHQKLYDTDRFELQAAGSKGSDNRNLYIYGDHLGSAILALDANQKEAMRLGYSPFGQVYRKQNDTKFWKLNSGVNANNQLNQLMPYQYTGRYTEGATGYTNLDARWYNPYTQRFNQPDYWSFNNTGLPKAVQHELMRFTGLNTAQLLRDPAQQMRFSYARQNPLISNDIYGLAIADWGPEHTAEIVIGGTIGNVPGLIAASVDVAFDLTTGHSALGWVAGEVTNSETFADGVDIVSDLKTGVKIIKHAGDITQSLVNGKVNPIDAFEAVGAGMALVSAANTSLTYVPQSSSLTTNVIPLGSAGGYCPAPGPSMRSQ